MAKFRALMFWTDAWIADTHHLTRLERGTYMDLLVLMWRSPECSVPNDDGWLGKRLGLTPAEVESELRPIIAEFCQGDGNRIWQKRLRQEYAHARSQSSRQSVRAKSRWDKEKGVYHGNADNQASGNASVTVTVPVSVKEESKKESPPAAPPKEGGMSARKKPPPAKVPLPEDFSPHHKTAEGLGWDAVRIERELERFKDSARANGRAYAVWQSAWNNWCSSKYQADVAPAGNLRHINGAGGNHGGRRSGSALEVLDRFESELKHRLQDEQSAADRAAIEGDPGGVSPRRLRGP